MYNAQHPIAIYNEVSFCADSEDIFLIMDSTTETAIIEPTYGKLIEFEGTAIVSMSQRVTYLYAQDRTP